MDNIRLEGARLEEHLREIHGDDFKEKLKPTDEQLKDNWMALAWCIGNGEVTVEEYKDKSGSKRKRTKMTGVTVDEALGHFKLRPHIEEREIDYGI